VPLPPCATETEVGDVDTVKLAGAEAVTVRETLDVCVIPPPMPVTVILYVPVAALDATVMLIVEVPAPVMDPGLKPTVTPLGCPLAVKPIEELKPPDTVLVTVDVPLLPCTTETELGDADRVKFAGGAADVTVRATVAVCVILPPVPVTVIVYVPVAAVADAVMDIVEVPAPAMDVGLKVTVTPAGWPLADKPIEELKPPDTAVVTVDVPLLPCATETEVGDADSVKLGDVDCPKSAFSRPTPLGLPQPVTRSYPVTAEKLPEVPLVTSWKSAL
jgi:hypothetical protein